MMSDMFEPGIRISTTVAATNPRWTVSGMTPSSTHDSPSVPEAGPPAAGRVRACRRTIGCERNDTVAAQQAPSQRPLSAILGSTGAADVRGAILEQYRR